MKGSPMSLPQSLFAFALAAIALPMGAAAQDAAATPETATTAPAAQATAADQSAERIERAGEDIVLGSEDAPLTIIEYASFTCSHCGTFSQNVMPSLKAEYIDTGKVKFIQRDVYFDAVGLWAGILARCEPEKFYAVGGMILDEQSKWLSPNSSTEELAEGLRKIGLRNGMDEAAIDACWNDEKFVEALVQAYQTNAEADQINATPTFIIGDQKVPNQSWTAMKKIIDDKLK